jgi:murein DD-endopeptidase MepM/ murein hydrolase activator NlpD
MMQLTEALKQARGSFAPVIVGADQGDWVRMDFTERNTELTDEILADTAKFSAWVSSHIAARNGRLGVGGYAEHRTIYRVSTVFDPATPDEEPRRLHLGVDIWSPEGTPVHCPFPGQVHSFSDQDRKGDYGAVIILQHEWEGLTFHTLYGHLSKASLDTYAGRHLEKGEGFAQLGGPAENGQWPPHLHFQVIADLGGRTGDYPGVCRYSERAAWLANCPDPDLILQLGIWGTETESSLQL